MPSPEAPTPALRAAIPPDTRVGLGSVRRVWPESLPSPPRRWVVPPLTAATSAATML